MFFIDMDLLVRRCLGFVAAFSEFFGCSACGLGSEKFEICLDFVVDLELNTLVQARSRYFG